MNSMTPEREWERGRERETERERAQGSELPHAGEAHFPHASEAHLTSNISDLSLPHAGETLLSNPPSTILYPPKTNPPKQRSTPPLPHSLPMHKHPRPTFPIASLDPPLSHLVLVVTTQDPPLSFSDRQPCTDEYKLSFGLVLDPPKTDRRRR